MSYSFWTTPRNGNIAEGSVLPVNPGPRPRAAEIQLKWKVVWIILLFSTAKEVLPCIQYSGKYIKREIKIVGGSY